MHPDLEADGTGSSPATLAAFAARLATGAAHLIRSTRDTASGPVLDADSKSTDTDLVTSTDRASERWLVEHILAARPEDGVLGEEGADRPGSSGVRWIVDPIDGTVNFVLGLPQYAVSVAAEVDETVVAGAVANVVTGELFHGWTGGGAYLGDRPLRGPRAVPLERAVIGTGFSYSAEVRSRQIAVVARLLPRIADIRRLGSASLDLCAVAAGRLDGYFEAGLSPWDCAAGLVIAAEAGVALSGLRGRAPGGAFTMAAGASCASDLIGLLEEFGADRVQ